jgi:acyl-CoA dehydrogenase
LAPVERAELIRNGVHGSLEGDLVFPASLIATGWFSSRFDGRATSASLVAAQMAGAMERVLTDTVRFANERSQFGKPIGQFQAIQQQISGMAEQVFSARMAAQLGCISTNHHPNILRSAVAKARASEATVTVAAVAHAVHGAMGITEEYDLQLFTRRLHEWRLAVGSETYWNRKIGQSIMSSSLDSSVDFIREQLSAEAI